MSFINDEQENGEATSKVSPDEDTLVQVAESSVQPDIAETSDVQPSPVLPTESDEDPSSNIPTTNEKIESPNHTETNEATTFQGIEELSSFVEEESENDVNKIASDIFYDIIHSSLTKTATRSLLYLEMDENDQITTFMENLIGALADDIEDGEREYVPHDEIYFWMTYFFLQFCGFRMFLAYLDEFIEHRENLVEMAQFVVELVDNVADNAPYLHFDSDLPLDVARNIVWQMLNSPIMKRRYNDKGVAYWHVEDILEDILEGICVDEIKSVASSMSSIKLKDSSESSILYSEEVKEPPECREYGGIFKVAEFFVSDLLEKGTTVISIGKSFHDWEPSRSTMVSKTVSSKKPLVRKKLVYPSIQEFSVKVGKKTLIEMITQWQRYNLKEDWAYRVKFLMGQSDSCSDYYLYEAKFGLPTEVYPVPQATCSLIFKIEVSRVKPAVCSVNITYKIEGSGFEYNPEEYVFQERWLLNLIEGKLRLFSLTHF